MPGGKFACFEGGDTSQFREDCAVYLAKDDTYKENPKGVRRAGIEIRKGRKVRKW